MPGGGLAQVGAEDVAHEHLLHQRRVDARPPESSLDGDGAELGGGEGGERAEQGADGRAGDADDAHVAGIQAVWGAASAGARGRSHGAVAAFAAAPCMLGWSSPAAGGRRWIWFFWGVGEAETAAARRY